MDTNGFWPIRENPPGLLDPERVISLVPSWVPGGGHHALSPANPANTAANDLTWTAPAQPGSWQLQARCHGHLVVHLAGDHATEHDARRHARDLADHVAERGLSVGVE